ncbi:MAG TPA: ATP-binding protein [Candidatus Saccharimonadales bacterium]|nr:ATP-binding protein [Candidatus Saccharimonadales bacterium]
MKQFDLPQPILYILIGLPGAGKSWFAKQFAETHQLARVSEDAIRYAIASDQQPVEAESEEVDRLAHLMSEELLRTGRSFIYDANSSRRSKRTELIQSARKAGYQTLTVWVQTDADTSLARAGRRVHTPESSMPVLDEETFNQLAKRLTPPTSQNSEPYVVISGKHTYSTQAHALHTRILRLYYGDREKENGERPRTNGEVSLKDAPIPHPKTTPKRTHFDISRPINVRGHEESRH